MRAVRRSFRPPASHAAAWCRLGRIFQRDRRGSFDERARPSADTEKGGFQPITAMAKHPFPSPEASRLGPHRRRTGRSGDGGFPRDDLVTRRDDDNVGDPFGLARNARRSAPASSRASRAAARPQGPVLPLPDPGGRAARAASGREAAAGGLDARFVVTSPNRKRAGAQILCEECRRMENRIKERPPVHRPDADRDPARQPAAPLLCGFRQRRGRSGQSASPRPETARRSSSTRTSAGSCYFFLPPEETVRPGSGEPADSCAVRGSTTLSPENRTAGPVRIRTPFPSVRPRPFAFHSTQNARFADRAKVPGRRSFQKTALATRIRPSDPMRASAFRADNREVRVPACTPWRAPPDQPLPASRTSMASAVELRTPRAAISRLPDPAR